MAGVVVGSIPGRLWGWLLKNGALCFAEDDDAGKPIPVKQPGPAEGVVRVHIQCGCSAIARPSSFMRNSRFGPHRCTTRLTRVTGR
jgi:hypothetical protein